jgi:hypothetical protein
VPSLLVRDCSVRPARDAQRTRDLGPDNPDGLPLIAAAQRDLRLKRHSAAGYLAPAAAATEAAAATTTTSVLHEALR